MEEGVIINGVKWATRNVNRPGTFAVKPEDPGMFYQWNRRKAWPATGMVSGWDNRDPLGDIWEKANDPSPVGWRVPTSDEFSTLFFPKNKVSNELITTVNGVTGIKFTEEITGNSLFLPAVGLRDYDFGMLNNVGMDGYYWSCSTPDYDSPYTYNLFFKSYSIHLGRFNADYDGFTGRTFGFPLRCVAE